MTIHKDKPQNIILIWFDQKCRISDYKMPQSFWKDLHFNPLHCGSWKSNTDLQIKMLSKHHRSAVTSKVYFSVNLDSATRGFDFYD